MTTSCSCKTWLKGIGLALLVVAVIGAMIGYDRGFREHPQPDWVTATPEMRFKYGSIGAEHDAGVPYWIFYVLPRVFPEKFVQDGKVVPGGYASLGVAWEQGQELPVGFTNKTIGFARVANNCAVCHTTSYRVSPDANPIFVVGGSAHTANVQGFFRLLIDCAKDPRFNADILMAEINRVTDLDFIDSLLYRFLIIPITKKRLLERETQFAWMYRPDFPEWGRGRDDAMNLTKYFMIKAPMDDTFGPTDMPSVWNLKKYVWDKGHRMNYAGDSHDAHSVIMDSALGVLGAPPADKADFLGAGAVAEGLHVGIAAAEISLPRQRRPRRRRQAAVRRQLRRLPRQRADRHAAAAGRSRHRPRPPRFVEQGRRHQGQPGGQGNGPGTPRPGRGRPEGLHRRPSSTASGSRRPTCTTARCRPCATCWNRPRNARKCSGAAMTSMIRRRSVSSATPRKRNGSARSLTPPARAVATRGMSLAPACPPAKRMPWSSI